MTNQWKRYQYISFDVFDTLIKRSVAVPSDIFRLMEQWCIRRGLAPNFLKKRMQANLDSEKKVGGCPVSLAEIYNELKSEYGTYVEELMNLEIQMEMDGCRPNTEAAALFRQCIDIGKTVVLISDMYLPADIITKMLNKCGISGYKKLYVSCELGCRKRDGSLYQKVLLELGIQPSQLLHFGDSWHNDILKAYANGIHACHIKNDQKVLMKVPRGIPEESSFTYRTLSACIRNSSTGLTEYEQQGCALFGPLLVGFVQWLAERLKEDKITDVFFLARDGYTLKRAFDSLEPTGFCTHYIYTSRRAFTVPLYWKTSSLEEIIALRNYGANSRITLRAFLKAVGLEPEQYKKHAAEYGLDLDRVYTSEHFMGDVNINSFYASVVEGDIKVNSRQEYEALLAYLRPFKLHGHIAVVDVGYQGTIQNALVRILAEEKINASVKGYYVGLCPSSSFVLNSEIDAEGYLYDVGKNENGFSRISQFANILETLFCEPCGSLKRFVTQNGRGVPEFSESEFAGKAGQLVDELSIITGYQDGAQKFVEYFREVFPRGIGNIEPDVAIFRMARMGLSPTLREAKLWGDIRRDKPIENGTRYIARPRSYWIYLRHPEQFKEDIYSSWRIGFLKRLLLLHLPYEKIYNKLKGTYIQQNYEKNH